MIYIKREIENIIKENNISIKVSYNKKKESLVKLNCNKKSILLKGLDEEIFKSEQDFILKGRGIEYEYLLQFIACQVVMSVYDYKYYCADYQIEDNEISRKQYEKCKEIALKVDNLINYDLALDIHMHGTSTNYYKDKECSILHREDGPAIDCDDGTKEWYLDGKLHREDGPAIEWPDGHKEWFLNGKHNRKFGPTIEFANGRKVWHLNGLHHREDGPAIESPDGEKNWYYNDQEYFNIESKEHWEKFIKTLIML